MWGYTEWVMTLTSDDFMHHIASGQSAQASHKPSLRVTLLGGREGKKDLETNDYGGRGRQERVEV